MNAQRLGARLALPVVGAPGPQGGQQLPVAVLGTQPLQRLQQFVQRIVVAGSRNQIRSIEYLQADGDRSEISIDPIEAP